MSVALFFFSCEDENNIIGIRNPRAKFEVSTIEFPLGSSVLALDSLITDNKSVPANLSLVGQYNDPMLGTMRAKSFLQIIPAFSTRIPVDAVYDSAVFQVRVNYYTYGLSTDHYEKFSIHQIAGEPLNRLSAHSYYQHDEAEYSTAIGQGSIYLDVEEMRRQYGFAVAQQDTMLIRSRLSDEVGQVLMNEALDAPAEFDDETDSVWRANFVNNFKGLALVPSSESSTMMALNLTPDEKGNLSWVYLYYHTPTDTARARFAINSPSFSNIVADRSATEIGGLARYQETDPASGLRYVQSGDPLTTKIDLANLYAFLDTTENIVVNEAAIFIDDVNSPAEFPAHSDFRFKILNDNNQIRNVRYETDATAMLNYYANLDGKHFAVRADDDSNFPYAVMTYDAKESRVKGYMTLFVQSLFANRNNATGINESRIKYLALFPNSPVATRTVNRTVFHKDKLKMRITYTRAIQENQE